MLFSVNSFLAEYSDDKFEFLKLLIITTFITISIIVIIVVVCHYNYIVIIIIIIITACAIFCGSSYLAIAIAIDCCCLSLRACSLMMVMIQLLWLLQIMTSAACLLRTEKSRPTGLFWQHRGSLFTDNEGELAEIDFVEGYDSNMDRRSYDVGDDGDGDLLGQATKERLQPLEMAPSLPEPCVHPCQEGMERWVRKELFLGIIIN